jgi:hypothetical protein
MFVTRRAFLRLGLVLATLLVAALTVSGRLTAAGTLQPPDQFIGFTVGEDKKLVRWDRIVEYMKLAAEGSDRVRFQELGKTSLGNPFIVLEISASETLRDLERYRQLERKLYFQNGAPTPRELDEIYRDGKVVVLVTCSVHGSEIGATQMVLELVHQLATDDSAATRKILDNVILLLVPSANPDGQILVTDWYNQTLGTPYEGSSLPYLQHPYAGHDSNRDMYMLTQKESQYLARLAWHDWFPAIWLDEHQMGSSGPRMFVMPAADPINPNVHPLIYRWNGILGQSQAAALEAAGKNGIIYSSTYTNFWQGALAWTGWWHNQIGVLTEVASARVASPVDQVRVLPNGSRQASEGGEVPAGGAPLPPPTDTVARTEYLRPWLGGRWRLRDIVDYERIATLALLETAADRRETILKQIYEVNRQTVEAGPGGDVATIVVPVESQHDPRQVGHLVDRLALGGVEVYRADAQFDLEGRRYPTGTFVIPMTQVFARYAKDLLERQVYPEVRRGPGAPVEEPYDVSAWSLGTLMGVEVEFSKARVSPSLRTTRVRARPQTSGRVMGNGTHFAFDYKGPDTAVAINRLLSAGARVEIGGGSRVTSHLVGRDLIESLAREFGLTVTASPAPKPASGPAAGLAVRAPRVAVYSPWTGGSADEGWTRWVLEQYEFEPTTIHNADIRRGELRDRYDVVVIPDQPPRDIVDGYSDATIRPEYRGGIGEQGVDSLTRFISEGGTVVTLGSASDFAIDRLGVPVRDLKRYLRREQHFGPGSILRLEVDTSHPLGYGMPPNAHGFYMNGPFFAPADDSAGARMTVVARFAAAGLLASGWLVGEDQMAGRATVVSVDMNPGRVVLFGLRPQHRAQTQATFPLLFNALYLSAAENTPVATNQ